MSKSFTLKYIGLFLTTFILLFSLRKISLDRQISNISKLIEIHYSGNGLVVGSFPLVSLFVQLVESNGEYSVQELNMADSDKLVFSKSFDKNKNFYLMPNRMQFKFSFKSNVAGHILMGKVIPSNRLLKNIFFQSLLLVSLIILIFYFIKKFLILKISSHKVVLVEQICHDIRSPLSVLNILSNKINFLNSDHKEIYLNSLERMSVVLNSYELRNEFFFDNKSFKSLYILDFIKNQFRNLSFRKKHLIDIQSLINKIINEKKTINSEVAIDSEIGSDLNISTYISKADLERILSNIINNSVDSIVNKSGFININAYKEINYLKISITDNGVGIPVDIIKSIGARGFSFGKSNGSGLGLWHAIKTLKEARGDLILESYENKGTIVVIKLPII